MRKLTLFNPTIEDVLLFVAPFIVSGEFSILGPRGRMTMYSDNGDWVLLEVAS